MPACFPAGTYRTIVNSGSESILGVMDTFMKADIFFFVTTVAVIVFLILGSIVLWYMIGILRDVKRASNTLERKIEEGSENLERMRQKVAESAVFNLVFGKKSSRAKK